MARAAGPGHWPFRDTARLTAAIGHAPGAAAVTPGLSMDYEVFLLSRIRESYDATGDNAAPVADGLARTARVITAAAAIMAVVFLAFVFGANVSVKQIGLGLAVAVLIDATLVRMVLVPAVMELLGQANWWLPGPLARVLPKTSRPEDEPRTGDPALARTAG